MKKKISYERLLTILFILLLCYIAFIIKKWELGIL